MFRYLMEDREFKELDIPLLPPQRRELEKRIIKYGRTEPLTSWRGYLLKGYEQYDICLKHHRVFECREVFFVKKSEALAWACREQLKRRDLQRPAIIWLLWRLYKALLEIEKRRDAMDQFQYKILSPSQSSEEINDKSRSNTEVQRTLGKEYGLHAGTIRNYAHYGKSLDRLEEMFPGIRNRVLKGEVEIPLMYMDILLEMPREELARRIENPQCRKLLPPEDCVQKALAKRDLRYRKKIHVETAIKEMPLYDPDADVNGLSLTIDAWIKAIARAKGKEGLSTATESGRQRLQASLQMLMRETEGLYQMLEEKEHERNDEPDRTAAQLCP